MGLLERYERQAMVLDHKRLRRMNVLSEFVHPDIAELIDIERRDWVPRDRRLRASGIPTAAAGFASPLLPNQEPVNAPAVVASSGELSMYTPATTTNADWALIPQGAIHAPQSLFITATGVYSNNSSTNTLTFGTRIGTSSTTANNISVGATGAVPIGSTLTNAMWWYQAQATVMSVGTSGTINVMSQVNVALQATGSVTSLGMALAGSSSATIDWTQQQGWVLTMKGNATGVTSGVTQFMIAAWD